MKKLTDLEKALYVITTHENTIEDLRRRLNDHSKGDSVSHICQDCSKKFWNVDDEPMVCPHCDCDKMPLLDEDAIVLAGDENTMDFSKRDALARGLIDHLKTSMAQKIDIPITDNDGCYQITVVKSL